MAVTKKRPVIKEQVGCQQSINKIFSCNKKPRKAF